jgi:hypothetical protein
MTSRPCRELRGIVASSLQRAMCILMAMVQVIEPRRQNQRQQRGVAAGAPPPRGNDDFWKFLVLGGVLWLANRF